MNVFEHILKVIAPHQCIGCGVEGVLLCGVCDNALTPVPRRCYRCGRLDDQARTCRSCRSQSEVFQVWAVTVYGGTARAVLQALKFERAAAAAEDIARSMAARLPQNSDWIVTHVPTSPVRIRQRGYDQAQLIAKKVARHLGCSYAPLLVRQGSQRQVGQGRATRQQQMQDAFRVTSIHAMHQRHVLVVDDVLTTGATLEAAARALKAVGARRISAAVFAAA